MTELPWYKTNPHLLQREKDALAAVGVEFEIDSTADGRGVMKIRLTVEASNPNFKLQGITGPLRLEASFPDNYPFFRPEVFADGLHLPRHQNPFGKNLCLLPRTTEHWDVEWTLAGYLQSQLPKVIGKGMVTDPDLIAADPDEQAEPASEYYPVSYHPVLIDASAFDSLVDIGSKEIRQIGKVRVGLEAAMLPVRMAVLSGASMDGNPLGELPSSIQDMFPHKFEGILLQLPDRPPHGHPMQDLLWLRKLVGSQPGSLTLSRMPLALKGGEKLTSVIGLNFPEEVGPGKMGRGWLFLIVKSFEQKVTLPSKRPFMQKMENAGYAKVSSVGARDIRIRVPQLKGLGNHKIALVGLGALGAHAAVELARNQVGEVSIMDFDVVEPGPSVRWPLGLAYSSLSKTAAIQAFISVNYPWTKVSPFAHKIGGVRNAEEKSKTEQQVMDDFLEGTSLLFDAAAESGVSHFLYSEAKRRGIPYVCVHATPGAWGGLVMRSVPGKTGGCWMCLKHWQNDKKIPVPVQDEAGEVQAAGCGDLTFTGAGFDLQNVTLAGVRLAVSTLLSGEGGGFPETDWDVGVLSLMDREGRVIPPSWETFRLGRHPECYLCSGG